MLHHLNLLKGHKKPQCIKVNHSLKDLLKICKLNKLLMIPTVNLLLDSNKDLLEEKYHKENLLWDREQKAFLEMLSLKISSNNRDRPEIEVLIKELVSQDTTQVLNKDTHKLNLRGQTLYHP